MKLWDAQTGMELASLITVDESGWLVVAPHGLFDGSPNGWKQILWRFNKSILEQAPVEAFFKEYWRPGLLQEIMAGKIPEPATKDLSAIDIRQPQIQIVSVGGQATIKQTLGEPAKLADPIGTRNIEIALDVTDNTKAPSGGDEPKSSGAKDLRLFRNGSLVQIWPGSIFDKQSGCELATTKPNEPQHAVCKTTVPVVAGENKFSAYAFNHEDVKSTDAEAVATATDSLRRSGTLYVLAVGVGENANPNFKLKYPVKDAQDFAAQVKAQQQNIARYSKTEVTLLLNAEATKEAVLAELNRLSGLVQPEDGLLIYFSGHGTAQGKRFYMLPYDIGYKGARTREAINRGNNLAELLGHSISDQYLEAALRTAGAGQIVMVIDACNSGQALNADDPRRGPMNSTGLAQLAYEKGMYILTASQDYEVAYESEALGHSYLTYALVDEGLKTTAADKNRDGQVDLHEWFDFAAREVPQLRQKRVEQSAKRQGKDLELVEAPEREKVQTPRVFYRKEPDFQPFVVAKTGRIK